MSPHRRSPRPLALALDRVQVGLAPQTLLAEVQQRWPEVVGESIAAQAEPTFERGGVLTVACAAAVWAQELDLMAPAVLDRLGQVLTRGEVSRLRCVTLPTSRPRW
jgi:predicted nucleic acid-binding Zn ribbon protein